MFLAAQPQPDDTATLDLFAASVKEISLGILPLRSKWRQ
jgi:hypothetical protein